MFDLEQSMAEWRRQMLAAGIVSPEVLDELEMHLRDDVEAQESAGLSTQEAFALAAKRMGQPGNIKTEFQLANSSFIPMDETTKLRLRGILIGIAMLAIGVALILPAVAHWRHQGPLTGAGIALLIVGILCSGAGAVTCIKRVRA